MVGWKSVAWPATLILLLHLGMSLLVSHLERPTTLNECVALHHSMSADITLL